LIASGLSLLALAGLTEEVPPWLNPYRDEIRHLIACADHTTSLAATLNRASAERAPVSLSAGALTFVPQVDLPEGEAYEAFIARTACVPTRDNLHDLFNGLVWLKFPQLKRRLNELQAQQLQQDGVMSTRGPVRDALTLFDENAAVLQAPAFLNNALRTHDWPALFVTHRAAWADASLTMFGHALMEKLTQPRKPMTAHVWVVPQRVNLQTHLIDMLTPALLASKPHLPMPVLGVPGWWAANEEPGYYDDIQVFRPLTKTPPNAQGIIRR
jgi:Protein of unknown function (DUF3025)